VVGVAGVEALEVALRRRADDPLRTHAPDDAADVTPEVEGRRQPAIGMAEERDVGDADDLRGGELLEEGWEPWAVDEMYVVAANPSDVFVDITDTFERKLDALRCHVSQMTDLDGLDARIRGWNAANAALGGLPEGRLAESYLRVDTQ
jgi:LmbE family N-acetylglucosaminyl deacetylase